MVQQTVESGDEASLDKDSTESIEETKRAS